MSLAVQRLEYACEVKTFLIPPEIQSTFVHFIQVLSSALQTDDPYVIQLMSSTRDRVGYAIVPVSRTFPPDSSHQIRWLLSPKSEHESHMASPVGLSLLCQVLRLTPMDDMLSMVEPFCGVLKDLQERKEWYDPIFEAADYIDSVRPTKYVHTNGTQQEFRSKVHQPSRHSCMHKLFCLSAADILHRSPTGKR